MSRLPVNLLLFRGLLLVAPCVFGVSGCMVNPVPTPEKSSSTFDNSAFDAAGGTLSGGTDGTKTNAGDTAGTPGLAGDATLNTAVDATLGGDAP